MSEHDYIRMLEITKTFGPVTANKKVNFSVRKGEIHAILGENGSGKSTLMNILSGIYSPESGRIEVNGKPVRIHSPGEAIALGIGMIPQHPKLIDVFSSEQNIIGGTRGGLFLHQKRIHEEIGAFCRRYGFDIDLKKMTYAMSISEKQTIEILKALYRGADVLILDEPTAVLTPQETERLFAILRNMRAEGCAVIIITHKLNEVLDISDRVTVMRKGESIHTIQTADATAELLTEMMVGRAIDLNIARTSAPERTEALVQISGLTVRGRDRQALLQDVSFHILPGEIFGIAGVAGSGQKELCEAIVGLQGVECGSIRFAGKELAGMKPADIQRRGLSISFVPEDRLGMGCAGGLSVADNVALRSYRSTRGIFMDKKSHRAQAQAIVERYCVSTPSIDQSVRCLSGGNIQKVLLGRELDQDPSLLITAYPVRGLDIGATHFIYDQLNEQKQKGVAVLFIGEDLDVLLALCDRIGVLHAGRLMGVVDARTATKDEIGLMMMGREAEAADV